jgi:hypothetical protein
MLNYQTLDAIADAVNPAMGVLALAFPWVRPPLRAQRALLMDLLTLLAVGIPYAVRAVDASFEVWGRLGLDYSTHTAVYVAIASALWQHGRVGRLLGVIVGVAYAALMLWQRYHSVLDIVTTALVTMSLLWVYWKKVACGAFLRQQLGCRRQKA